MQWDDQILYKHDIMDTYKNFKYNTKWKQMERKRKLGWSGLKGKNDDRIERDERIRD